MVTPAKDQTSQNPRWMGGVWGYVQVKVEIFMVKICRNDAMSQTDCEF